MVPAKLDTSQTEGKVGASGGRRRIEWTISQSQEILGISQIRKTGLKDKQEDTSSDEYMFRGALFEGYALRAGICFLRLL